jgi:hypothetical protein
MQNFGQLFQNYTTLFAIFVSFLLIIFLSWNIILSLKIKGLKKRSRELFAGNKVSNLEDLLLEQAKSIRVLDKDIQELYDISNQINSLASRGLQKFAMVRFNPFKDIGGDQSFSLAILNGKNNGLILSSHHTREGTRIYAKSIADGVSEKHTLTDEEKEAIKLAIEKESKLGKN